MAFCKLRLACGSIFLPLIWSCANPGQVAEVSNTRGFEVVLVALQSSVIKDSTEQSMSLDSHRKCKIVVGESIQLKEEPKLVQTDNGPHYKITLLPEQQLSAPCRIESAYVFASHFRQELFQSGTRNPSSPAPDVPQQSPSPGSQNAEQRFAWPTQSGVVTSGFGQRFGVLHEGIDIALLTGSPILASAAGHIAFAGWSSAGFGNLIRLAHPDNFETRYAHNSDLLDMTVGKVILAGDQIAKSGNTGLSTGSHLHFEIRTRGKAVDPMYHLPR
ncbi:MAG: M23 family metallopeptidase [Betaproteobacteria bacterium]|nr:M23 family metallopeptidase [Betaproteobacteria bacterium]